MPNSVKSIKKFNHYQIMGFLDLPLYSPDSIIMKNIDKKEIDTMTIRSICQYKSVFLQKYDLSKHFCQGFANELK